MVESRHFSLAGISRLVSGCLGGGGGGGGEGGGTSLNNTYRSISEEVSESGT